MEKTRNLPASVQGGDVIPHREPSDWALPVETRARAVEAGIDVAKEVCSMLVFAANVHVEGSQLRQRTEAAWETTKQRIALIDAESAAEVAKLVRGLEEIQETTKQIQMIVECIVRVSGLPNPPEEICRGLRGALVNLTQRG